MYNMTEPLVSEIDVTEPNSDLKIVSETRLNYPLLLLNKNQSHKNDSKTLMDYSSLNYESEYEEQCSYAMMIRNSTSDRKEFLHTSRYVAKMLKWRLVASFLFVICAVILLYQVPVVFYYTTINPHVDSSDITDYLDFKSCSVKVDPVEIQADELLLNECNNTVTGFGDYLDCHDSAIAGLSLIYIVGLYVDNTECYYDSLSFFCNATLLLCNGNSYSVDLTEECEEVRDNKCASEWRIVESFFNTTVPDCMSYNEYGELTYSLAPPLPCPSEFNHFCGSTCLPVCDGHLLFTKNTLDLVFYVLAIITGAISLIGGVITLIACYYNQGRMLQFPQVYILYNTAVWIIFVVLENLPVVVGKSLVCSDRNYWIAVKETTNFCQFQGFILQFGYGLFFGFWCFHLFHLFLSLSFPFKTKQLLDSSSHRRMIHITEVTIVLLVSVIPPIITLTVSQYESNGYYCFPQSPTVLFYGEILPSMLKLCIGLVLIFLSFRLLRKENRWKSSNAITSKVFCTGYSIVEVKLILLFCYYAVNFLTYLTALVVYLYVLSDYFVNFFEYQICSAGGYKEECEIHRERAEESFIPSTIMSILSVLLFSMISFSHLMYVIHFRSAKKAIQDTLKSWNCIQL